MTKKYYQPQLAQPLAITELPLPINRPIAVYYRQSTDGQIGNESTTMQTVDMVEYLKQRGWQPENIIMIDMDGGVSGTKKIDERPGMSYLFDLITEQQIGAVACQDEDRLFRDITQIQVNIFIEACRSNDVMVLTPTMVYQFSNSALYSFHARQFRFKCEMAAEYINVFVRGKLAGAKRNMLLRGLWVGGTVPTGYMVDTREYLADGSRNDNWRKYVPFEPFASIVREYFHLYLSFNGNLRRTASHIHQHGPFYPSPESINLPNGFTTRLEIKQYGNGYCPSYAGLSDLLTNSAYIGYWTYKGVVISTNNHEPIVEVDVFMRVFNYLSKVDLDGKPNQHYMRITEHARPDVESKRNVDPPLCSGLMWSQEADEWRKVGKEYKKRNHLYIYAFRANDQMGKVLWVRSAKKIDNEIASLIQQKLSATFDVNVWEQTITLSEKQYLKERKRLQKQLHLLERTMENQVANLDNVTNPEMLRALEKRYEDAQIEHKRLSQELAAMASKQTHINSIRDLKQNWSQILTTWDELNYQQKRSVVLAFIERIEVLPLEEYGSQITVYWRDNSSDVITQRRFSAKGTAWLKSEVDEILELFRQGADQLHIAARFPDRPWDKIIWIIEKVYGEDAHRFPYQPMHWLETFNDFAKRYGDKPLPLRSMGMVWRANEDKLIVDLIQAGANRTEIASHFPFKTWRSIRDRIRVLLGNYVPIDGRGQKTVMLRETYMEFLLRTGELDPNSLPTLQAVVSDVQSL